MVKYTDTLVKFALWTSQFFGCSLWLFFIHIIVLSAHEDKGLGKKTVDMRQ